MKIYECDASQWFPSMRVRVVVGDDRCRRAMGRINPAECPAGAAWTYHEGGEDWCMVCLTDEWARSEEDQRVALAAHEAVHCALAWAESMGEDTPGDEELAYMVQCCMLAILDGARQEAERGRK